MVHGQASRKPRGEAGGGQGRVPVVFPCRAQGGRTGDGASTWPRWGGGSRARCGTTAAGPLSERWPGNYLSLVFSALREHWKGLRELNPSWMDPMDFSQMTSQTLADSPGPSPPRHNPAPAPSSSLTQHSGPWGLKTWTPNPQAWNSEPPGPLDLTPQLHSQALARRRPSFWKSPGGGMQGGSHVPLGRGAWLGERAVHTKPPFSSPAALPPGKGEPVQISREGFLSRLCPLLPAKPLCVPASWSASISINTSSLRGLGSFPHPAPAYGPGRPSPSSCSLCPGRAGICGRQRQIGPAEGGAKAQT